MEWGFSDLQIDEFNHTLRRGRLMKYQSLGLNGTIAWSVEDIHDFCLDMGDEMGLPKDLSEFFAASADDYYQRGKMTFYGSVPTRHFISFDHGNISIERGKEVQINMTYRFAWDDPPEKVRFNATKTPLTLAYSPSEIASVRPFHEYPVVALITADSSRKPEVYQMRISIEGKNRTKYTCRDIDSGTIHNNILSVPVI